MNLKVLSLYFWFGLWSFARFMIPIWPRLDKMTRNWAFKSWHNYYDSKEKVGYSDFIMNCAVMKIEKE